jgi:phage/conjugal plasmid C-4 type zinc finger TraR family protein
MADKADLAQELIERRMEEAMAARQHFVGVNKMVGSVECIECGDAIPAARRERLPGVMFCVPCQTRREGRR